MAVLTIFVGYPHLLNKSVELDVSKSFCKPVGDYLLGRNIQEFDSF